MTPDSPQTPRTEAGKRLQGTHTPADNPVVPEAPFCRDGEWWPCSFVQGILAIEAEAAMQSSPVDLRAALEPFAAVARSEASRPEAEDGYFDRPGGVTVGDWRRLDAALRAVPAEARSLAPESEQREGIDQRANRLHRERRQAPKQRNGARAPINWKSERQPESEGLRAALDKIKGIADAIRDAGMPNYADILMEARAATPPAEPTE